MRNVAREAGIGTMTTYRHFENRDALLATLVRDGFARFEQGVASALDGDTPEERLLLSADAYREFARQHPALYRLMFMEPLLFRALPLSSSDRTQIASAHRFLRDRVIECGFDVDAADVIATDLWAHCHGLVSLELVGRLAHTHPADFYRESVVRVVSRL